MSLQTPIHEKKRFNIELLLGISATLLSIFALGVSIYQAKIAREYQYASVWPHLQVVYTHHNDKFTWAIINNGVGPAIIQSFALAYQGKNYQSPYHLVAKCIKQLQELEEKQDIRLDISDISPGYVIKSGGEVMLCSIENSVPVANAMRQIIDDSLYHFQVVFSDIYHNCWQNDRDKVTPLSDCQDNY